jgi:hypothetical protein
MEQNREHELEVEISKLQRRVEQLTQLNMNLTARLKFLAAYGELVPKQEDSYEHNGPRC